MSGQPALVDGNAVDDVEAILVGPEEIRSLMVAEAELGEKITRALSLRRTNLIDRGAGGPILIGRSSSRDMVRLQTFLTRNAWPNSVIDPEEDREGLALLVHFRVENPDSPLVVCPDGWLLRNPSEADLATQLGMLAHATDTCATGAFDALVTAPVQKSVMMDAGIPFSGHTEYLAHRTHTPRVVMLLVGGAREAPLRVALATTHLPLREVSDHITPQSLEEVLRILHGDLRRHFGIRDPHVLVAGLNPHAGEGGHLGREEIDVIIPCLQRLRAEGMKLSGPLPADTLFTPHHLERADAVLAMYHDQGLIPFKTLATGEGVNYTAGLPAVRTSPDHGVAFDIAGKDQADTSSFITAVFECIDILNRRSDYEENRKNPLRKMTPAILANAKDEVLDE